MTVAPIVVSRETEAALRVYEEELRKWQRSINLVGPDTLKDLRQRHFLDSLQLRRVMPARARYVVDLGSGAGFPGLVLAIDMKQTDGARVTLVESNHKKAAFLRHVALKVQAPATIVADRIETYVQHAETPDVVTARALAPLPLLLQWCWPLLKTGAIALFPKGRGVASEVADAARSWTFDHEIVPSLLSPESAIVKITSLAPR